MTQLDEAPAEPVEDLIPPLSNSEIQTFIDCKRRWYLTFYRGLGPKATERPIVGALAFGSRVHECLERMYVTGEDPLEVYEELHSKAVYDLLYREAEHGFIDPDTRKKLQDERELGHAMLEGYVAWTQESGLDEGLRVAGAEVVVVVASGVEGVRLRGKLDQRVYRDVDGARLFRDFKTAADLKSGPQLLPLDEQMKYYMMLERLDALAKTGDEPPEPTQGGLYTMLKKVKRTGRANPPFYDQVEVHHNKRELESMWLRTHRRIQEILEVRGALDTGGDHRFWVYPRPSRDCSWKCPFLSVCPLMDDSSEETWNALLAAQYEYVDPYERYVEDEIKS
jgi:RecB family exonuclease